MNIITNGMFYLAMEGGHLKTTVFRSNAKHFTEDAANVIISRPGIEIICGVERSYDAAMPHRYNTAFIPTKGWYITKL